MISQECMLGDWVVLNPDLKGYYPFAGKPCMVIGLQDDDGAIKIEYDNGKYFWTDTEDDVIPIPLTPEILEKNGFKECDGEQWSFYKYKDDDYTKQSLYHVLWSKNEQYLEISAYTPHFGEYNRMGVLFVHELQHALKLCGIEKTIEL